MAAERFGLDTNVLVYLVDGRDTARQARAREVGLRFDEPERVREIVCAFHDEAMMSGDRDEGEPVYPSRSD